MPMPWNAWMSAPASFAVLGGARWDGRQRGRAGRIGVMSRRCRGMMRQAAAGPQAVSGALRIPRQDGFSLLLHLLPSGYYPWLGDPCPLALRERLAHGSKVTWVRAQNPRTMASSRDMTMPMTLG